MALEHARQPGECGVEAGRLNREEQRNRPRDRVAQQRPGARHPDAGRARRPLRPRTAAAPTRASATAAGIAQTASPGRQPPPNALATGTDTPAASAAKPISAVLYIPVIESDAVGKLPRTSTGSSTFPTAIAAPAIAVPKNRKREPGYEADEQAEQEQGERARRPSSARPNRRASTGASGASAPKQSTGSATSTSAPTFGQSRVGLDPVDQRPDAGGGGTQVRRDQHHADRQQDRRPRPPDAPAVQSTVGNPARFLTPLDPPGIRRDTRRRSTPHRRIPTREFGSDPERSRRAPGAEFPELPAGEPLGAAAVEPFDRRPDQARHVALDVVSDLRLHVGEVAVPVGNPASTSASSANVTAGSTGSSRSFS